MTNNETNEEDGIGLEFVRLDPSRVMGPTQLLGPDLHLEETNPTVPGFIDDVTFDIWFDSVPVPPLSEIPNGCDAIFQVTPNWLSGAPVVLREREIPYDESEYGNEFRRAVDEAVERIENEWNRDSASPGDAFYASYDPVAIVVGPPHPRPRPASQSVVLEPGVADTVGLRFAVTVSVIASGSVNVPPVWEDALPEDSPALNPPNRREQIDEGEISLSVPLEIETDEAELTTKAVIALDRANPAFTAEPAFSDGLGDHLDRLLDRLTDDLRDADRSQITPTFALTGDKEIRSGLPGIEAFTVRPTVTKGNRPGESNRVLSLCVSTRSDPVISEDVVRPFVGDRSFAYYVDESIVKAVVKDAWESVSEGDTAFEYERTIEGEQRGEDIEVFARIRITHDSLDAVSLVVGSEEWPDAVQLSGRLKSTLLEAWADSSKEDEIKLPEERYATDPYAWNIFPFTKREEFERARTLPVLFAKNLYRQLFAPIISPLRDEGGIHGPENIEGATKAPIGGIFLRGN